MGLFQNEIQVIEKPKHNKHDKVKLKLFNGYDSIREEVDQGNTLIVKNPVVIEKAKTKVSIGL